MALTKYKSITIDRGQVSGGPHLNFPLYLNITDSDLAATARADGYDIRFFADVNQVTEYNYHRYYWDSSLGVWRGRVLIPSGVDNASDPCRCSGNRHVLQ